MSPFYFGDYDNSQTDSNKNPEYSLIMDFDNSRVILQNNQNYALNQFFYFSQNINGVRAYLSANQSIADATETKVQIDTVQADTKSQFSTSNNRFTVAAGQAGNYMAIFNTEFAAGGSAGERKIIIKKNGTGNKAVSSNPSTNEIISLSCSAGFGMEEGDYLEFIVKQTSGGNLNITGGLNSTHIEIARLS